MHAIIEAPVLRQAHPTTDDHVPGSGERLSAGVLASSRTMDSRVREMLGSTSLAEPAALLPAAVVPTLATASVPETQSLAVVHAVFPSFAGPFTASSGERVLFSQQEGEWQAVLAPSTRLYGHKHMLPVVGSGDIGASLAALRGADAWSSRSRIHVLSDPHASPISCVYVGKLGLLGGMQTNRVVEWRPGPHIRLETSNDACTAVYHIPLGDRYWGYREGPESIVQRASCTVRYVEAHSVEEITRLTSCQDEGSLDAHLAANFANVVGVGTLGGGGYRAQSHSRHGGHTSRFTHAALVVFASTKKKRLWKKESKVDVQLEIGIERVDPREGEMSREARSREAAARQRQAEVLRREEEIGSIITSQKADLERIQAELTRQDAAMREAIQSKIDLLSRQHKNETQHLASLRIPAMAIGPKEWAQYFGEVGEAPSLPADINQILNSPCPFWSGKKVSDTHLLVLVPATVDGNPFTLDLLGKLIKSPKEGSQKTKYRDYPDAVQKELGSQSPGRSYWVLMTREVLEGSRNTDYASQQSLIAAHASETGLSYELPGALEAATVMLSHYVRTGERLYSDSPWICTRCRELVEVYCDEEEEAYEFPVVVGGFSSGGLDVNFHSHDSHDCSNVLGVSCLRKF
jgi:hypothetical protein